MKVMLEEQEIWRLGGKGGSVDAIISSGANRVTRMSRGSCRRLDAATDTSCTVERAATFEDEVESLSEKLESDGMDILRRYRDDFAIRSATASNRRATWNILRCVVSEFGAERSRSALLERRSVLVYMHDGCVTSRSSWRHVGAGRIPRDKDEQVDRTEETGGR